MESFVLLTYFLPHSSIPTLTYSCLTSLLIHLSTPTSTHSLTHTHTHTHTFICTHSLIEQKLKQTNQPTNKRIHNSLLVQRSIITLNCLYLGVITSATLPCRRITSFNISSMSFQPAAEATKADWGR